MVRDINERNRRKFAKIKRDVDIQNSPELGGKRNENYFQVSNSRDNSPEQEIEGFMVQVNKVQNNLEEHSINNSMDLKDNLMDRR